jgi:hypothetical protein
VAELYAGQDPGDDFFRIVAVIAFSLPVHTEQPLPTWLFLKKSRTSRRLPVQSRSENALEGPEKDDTAG